MPGVEYSPLVAIVLLPLAGAVLALPAGLRGYRRTMVACAAGGIGLGTAVTGHALYRVARSGTLFTVVGNWSPTTGIGLILDLPSAWILPAVGVVAAAIFCYALGGGYGNTVFIVAFTITVSGLGAVILADDLFNLFVALEVVSLAAMILVAYERTPRALYAALRYLIISTISIALYLVGLLVLYRETGELALHRIAIILANTPTPGSVDAVGFALAMIVTGLATRVALVPFHAWLPDAHGSAPHPVSALLSGLVLKAGFVALWRLVRILPPGAWRLNEVLLIMGGLSALIGVGLALVQSDAKRLLAYHSISQMGLIVLGAGAISAAGPVFHAVSHATFKSLLFLLVGVMVVRWNTHDLYRMREGNRVTRPRWYEQLLYIVGAGAIAGVPGLSGFVGKTLIATAVKESATLNILVKVVSVGTVASFLKLGTVFFPGRAVRDDEIAPLPGDDNALMVGGMTVLAVITLVLGVGGGAFFGTFSPAALLDSAVIIGAGAGLYALIRSRSGKRVAHRVERVRLGLDAALVCVLIGTVMLAVVI